jgi:antitoxin component of RelBE/YafQ-DinJ toxin-antitoxin module
MIEAALGQIRVAVEVAENACAIASHTRMVGSDLFRIFLQHYAAHRDVMQIA